MVNVSLRVGNKFLVFIYAAAALTTLSMAQPSIGEASELITFTGGQSIDVPVEYEGQLLFGVQTGSSLAVFSSQEDGSNPSEQAVLSTDLDPDTIWGFSRIPMTPWWYYFISPPGEDGVIGRVDLRDLSSGGSSIASGSGRVDAVRIGDREQRVYFRDEAGIHWMSLGDVQVNDLITHPSAFTDEASSYALAMDIAPGFIYYDQAGGGIARANRDLIHGPDSTDLELDWVAAPAANVVATRSHVYFTRSAQGSVYRKAVTASADDEPDLVLDGVTTPAGLKLEFFETSEEQPVAIWWQGCDGGVCSVLWRASLFEIGEDCDAKYACGPHGLCGGDKACWCDEGWFGAECNLDRDPEEIGNTSTWVHVVMAGSGVAMIGLLSYTTLHHKGYVGEYTPLPPIDDDGDAAAHGTGKDQPSPASESTYVPPALVVVDEKKLASRVHEDGDKENKGLPSSVPSVETGEDGKKPRSGSKRRGGSKRRSSKREGSKGSKGSKGSRGSSKGLANAPTPKKRSGSGRKKGSVRRSKGVSSSDSPASVADS